MSSIILRKTLRFSSYETKRPIHQSQIANNAINLKINNMFFKFKTFKARKVKN